MAKSLYNFGEVEAKRAKPLVAVDIIRTLLREQDCYARVERCLMPPGPSGSKSFDQAYAVLELLNCDAENGGRLATHMEATGMSRRIVWDKLQAVLRNAGFRMSHGRLVGLLEAPDEQPESNGQPDVD